MRKCFPQIGDLYISCDFCQTALNNMAKQLRYIKINIIFGELKE